MPTVGVVGPKDLVDVVADVVADMGDARVRRLVYQHETEAPQLVRSAHSDVDAFLFTGIVPYTLAIDAGVVQHPADYVPYSGATLLRGLVQLLRAGHDITRMSIDTLTEDQVRETLAEAELPDRDVHVLEYTADTTSGDIVAFHRATRDRHGSSVAVTCLRSAYDVLRDELQTLRLTPSVHSVRAAARSVVLQTVGAQRGDAQVVLGFVELTGGEPRLRQEVATLGGSLTRLDDRTSLIVTTRGLLEQVTEGFTKLPMLARLSRRHDTVRMGFGIGRSAADAEVLARRAVGRARAAGDIAAAVALSEDADIIIDTATGMPPPEGARDSLPRLAQRAGLTKKTLNRLRELGAQTENRELTTAGVAEHLGVQQRTARRILKRLERAGAAEPVGLGHSGRSGRPPVVYRMRF